jgi:hypothetical protein
MKKLGRFIIAVISIRSFLIGWSVFARSVLLWLIATSAAIFFTNRFLNDVDPAEFIRDILLSIVIIACGYMLYALAKWGLRVTAKKYACTLTQEGKAVWSIAWRWIAAQLIVIIVLIPTRSINLWVISLIVFIAQVYITIASLGWACEAVIIHKTKLRGGDT